MRARFGQKTHSLGDASFPCEKALAAADAIEDAEVCRELQAWESELETLLEEGLSSEPLAEEEFWASYEKRRDALFDRGKP